mmetsp:Transcript_11353/g.28770  ORF Transcript_11353/g.28770 Transcript_11353/m.28770 type:complete len:219 (+) Transcript_11353:717-1373(+)
MWQGTPVRSGNRTRSLRGAANTTHPPTLPPPARPATSSVHDTPGLSENASSFKQSSALAGARPARNGRGPAVGRPGAPTDRPEAPKFFICGGPSAPNPLIATAGLFKSAVEMLTSPKDAARAESARARIDSRAESRPDRNETVQDGEFAHLSETEITETPDKAPPPPDSRVLALAWSVDANSALTSSPTDRISRTSRWPLANPRPAKANDLCVRYSLP